MDCRVGVAFLPDERRELGDFGAGARRLEGHLRRALAIPREGSVSGLGQWRSVALEQHDIMAITRKKER